MEPLKTSYRSGKPEPDSRYHRLEVLIAYQIRQIKDVDTPPQKGYPHRNFRHFSSPANFQPNNANITEMAMKARHSKVLKVKPPKQCCPFPEALLF